METLIQFTIQLFNALFTTPQSVEVSLSIVTWGPLAVSAGLGAAQHLAGRWRRRRADREAGQIRERRDEQLEDFERILGGLEERAEAIPTDLSPEELYGPQMQQLQDRVTAGAGATEAGLMRAVLAGGGDVTGQISEQIAGVGEGAQRSISDIVREYTERTDRRNLQQQLRQDRQLQQVLGGRQQMFGQLAGIEAQERGRADRMRTADRQLLLDTLGAGASLTGQLAQTQAITRAIGGEGLAGGVANVAGAEDYLPPTLPTGARDEDQDFMFPDFPIYRRDFRALVS